MYPELGFSTRVFRPVALVATGLGAALLLLCGGLPAAETLILSDDLAGTTVGQAVGGTLTTDGYVPNAAGGVTSHHLLYQLPGTVYEGRLEFQVRGLNPATLPADADLGLCGMYDGRGVSEPADYFQHFKQNYFRWNVHWRNERKALKCVITCAHPTVPRQTAGRAIFPDAENSRDWSLEPTGTGFAWQPDTWHTVRVEWKDRTFAVSVDGQTLWSVTGPYDYAPVVHRLWIGGAPGYDLKYRASQPGLTFRRVRLYSHHGTVGPFDHVADAQGWEDTRWCGQLQDFFPYVRHREHGWMYLVTAGDGFLAYNYTDQLGWLYFSRATYPFLYTFDYESWWYYFPGGGQGGQPRWFYDTSASTPQVPVFVRFP